MQSSGGRLDSSGECDLYGDFGNEILYRMCAENPSHANVEIVHGKLWLIGRAYAASVERKARKGFLQKHAAQNLVDAGTEIDSKIGDLAKITRVDASNLTTVLDAHHYLTERFRQSTGLAKRSLASKYLHFHARNAVFIYDSIAATRIGKEMGLMRSARSFRALNGYDETYTAFATRCLQFRDHILEPYLGRPVDPRELDKYLYSQGAIATLMPLFSHISLRSSRNAKHDE